MNDAIRTLYVSADADTALDSYGVEEVRAVSGADALKRLENGGVDCVASEVPVPRMDTVGFVESVRSIDPSVPVFLVGDPDGGARIDPALSAGATGHAETVTPALVDRIRRAASERRTERALDRHRRLKGLVRRTIVSLVGAESREDALGDLYRRLVSADLYRFVWVGEYDGAEGTFRPRQSANGPLPVDEFASLVGCESGAFLGRAATEGRVEAVAGSPELRGASAAAPGPAGTSAGDGVTCIAIGLADGAVAVLVADGRPPLDRSERSLLAELGSAVGNVLSLVGHGEEYERFTRKLAHELRNPLGIAMANIQLDRETDDPEHLDRAEAALRELERAIDGVLELAGRDAVEQADRHELSTVAADVWSTIEAPGAELVTGGSGPVEADRDLLALLLSNLFRNAVEHSSTSPRPEDETAAEHGSASPRPEGTDGAEGGPASTRGGEDGAERGSEADGTGADDAVVRIGTLEDGFYVEDDGPGIPPRLRERVFEWGFSADGGTGIGLSLVKEVADLHGWEIAVAEAPDGGARFEITGAG